MNTEEILSDILSRFDKNVINKTEAVNEILLLFNNSNTESVIDYTSDMPEDDESIDAISK